MSPWIGDSIDILNIKATINYHILKTILSGANLKKKIILLNN